VSGIVVFLLLRFFEWGGDAMCTIEILLAALISANSLLPPLSTTDMTRIVIHPIYIPPDPAADLRRQADRIEAKDAEIQKIRDVINACRG